MIHIETVHTIVALAALASLMVGLLQLKQILLRWGKAAR